MIFARSIIFSALVAVIAADIMSLPIVIHDFYPCLSSEVDFSFGAPQNLQYCNPDIEPHQITQNPNWGWGISTANTGMVQTTLGPNRKPVYAMADVGSNTNPTQQVHSAASFALWFSDTHPGNINIQYNLTLVQNAQGLYAYQNEYFYPLDNRGWGNNGVSDQYSIHNWGFCAEAHVQFLYDPNASFNFTGDDDMWIFMNNQLAFDIGGIHTAVTQNQRLGDLPFASSMVNGNAYPMDIFYCERQTLASTISLTTTVNIFCPPSQLDACGICGGSGACCPQKSQCVAPNPCQLAIFNPTNCGCSIVDNTNLINQCNAESNKCQTAQCDPTSAFPGSCAVTAISPRAYDACTHAQCDPQVGWIYNLTVCPSGNPASCYPGYCDVPSGGTCKTSNLCPNGVNWCQQKNITCVAPDACHVSTCISNSTLETGVCVVTPNPQAPQGDYCTSYSCNPTTGVYTSTARVCGDPTNKCQIGTCFPSNSSCSVATTVCNDHNACTSDMCVTSTGNCSFTPIPINNSDDYCSVTTCDPVSGFAENNVTCRGINCQRNSKTPGCCTCGLSPAVIAGITTGAAVGIAVGAAAGLAIIGVGGKVGYDYMSANAAAAGGVQNNPMYVGTDSNTNPLHEAPMV